MISLSHSSRIILVAGLIAMLAQGALAHTYLSSVYLNGVALADGDCMRAHPATGYDSPITFLNQSDMTCGWLPYASQPANRKCPIAAGSTIGLQWHHQTSLPTDDIVDPSHIGPIIVYLAKSDTGAGNVWFKIYEAGYDATTQLWAVNKLIANKGRVDITLPSDIAPGNYLLRGEVLALHGAYALNGVQPYVGCVELTISGTGSSSPAGVAIPGTYRNTDPGMLFNIYQPYTSYPIPGPPIYSGSHASSTTGSSPSTSAPTPAPPVTTPTVAPPVTTPTVAPPVTTPTYPPATGGSTIKFQLNSGTGAWWFGVAVSGGSEPTVKVEIADAGLITTWSALEANPTIGWVYDHHVQLTPPFSLRVTSASGKQITFPNIIRTISTAVIDTGLNYGSTATNPPPSQPSSTTGTAAAPPSSGSGSDAKVTVHQSSSLWWFAVVVTYPGSISTVDFMDSGSVSSYKPMTNNGWGYSYSPNGVQLVAPFSVRVTSSTGKQVVAHIPSVTAGLVVDAGNL